MRNVGKWFLIFYVVQAVAGASFGVYVAVKYGDKAQSVLNNVAQHLEDVANGVTR